MAEEDVLESEGTKAWVGHDDAGVREHEGEGVADGGSEWKNDQPFVQPFH